MPLEPLPVTDTRAYFRPLGREFVALLESLSRPAWDLPTVAGEWKVRDVVAHLTDTALRRLSHHRDALMEDASSSAGPVDEREIAALVNGLNASWVAAARRFSPRVLTRLYAAAIEDLAGFFEGLPLDAPALFGVSWAGEESSAGWFDVAREFTEQWHHQAQIRDAVGAPAPSDPAWLRAVLETAVRGLPHAYRGVAAERGTTVALEISGPSGGVWTLERDDRGWRIARGAGASPDAAASLTDDTAWRLLFNGLTPEDADGRVTRRGDARWSAPLLAARSVIL
jgi:uncharacterized protein (TIGR03083 family)